MHLDEDELFDQQFPPSIRIHSPIHFTSVSVAKRAARLLTPRSGMRVLDVGAGPGKFCVVAAREVPDSTFVGVEIRPSLVEFARSLASRVRVDNVDFIQANAMDLDWSGYDAFYLFNPFAEQLWGDDGFVLDRSLPCDPSTFIEYVAGVRQRLALTRLGTLVVTYHGFGAPLPFGFDLVEDHDARLQLWIKARHLIDVEDDVSRD